MKANLVLTIFGLLLIPQALFSADQKAEVGGGDTQAPASPVAQSSVSQNDTSLGSDDKNTLVDFLKLRDPFKPPAEAAKVSDSRSDLEKFPLDSFKMVGVVTGPNKLRALVQSPDGKTHFVGEKVKMGEKGGVVQKITTESIQIREKSSNMVGQEENIDTELKLPEALRVRETTSVDNLTKSVEGNGLGGEDLFGQGLGGKPKKKAEAFDGTQGFDTSVLEKVKPKELDPGLGAQGAAIPQGTGLPFETGAAPTGKLPGSQ